jgi:hypothetical protein
MDPFAFYEEQQNFSLAQAARELELCGIVGRPSPA